MSAAASDLTPGRSMPEVVSLDPYKRAFGDLSNMQAEAKDNVKFLNTLDRQFKNISQGDLGEIRETLPSLFQGLKLVWVISRHYNSDDRMAGLLEAIANEISECIGREIKVHEIFKKYENNYEAAQIKIESAIGVLDEWEKGFRNTRNEIANENSDKRWDFDHTKMFGKTKHMKIVCENLKEAAIVLAEFDAFLGTELKQVTGDADGIDRLREKVKDLVKPLEDFAFPIFNNNYAKTWEKTFTDDFQAKVIKKEEDTINVMNKSFSRLPSSLGGFELLAKFKDIKTRDSIKQNMNMKFKDILNVYNKELNQLKDLFEKGKNNPPISKNMPPVSGAIRWARSLYHRAKKPILRFQT